MRQSLDEGAQVVGLVKASTFLVLELRIEAVRTALALEADQIIKLTLAGLLHPSAG
ncbi:hypothetical protein [Acidithiobacillus sulfuriphilus]|uniref:hypothetical protein n=1 Tax=Acidithiobacillus sulfuriphilus TaxID=1867749 RepID=UPI003F60CAF7